LTVREEIMAKKKVTAKKSGKTVRVTLVRGVVGTRESHRATVRGLGLRRINHTVELEDTPAVRGMINKVSYLVKCEA
jgi:large subunit ribosomal protein L30